MPWRKAWIDPFSEPDESALRGKLERRAYEVWISEIMLQQTRVAVVIDYWNKWMAQWPTIHELAAASADDVLAAWRGLGYYSRATRIHEAAKLVTKDGEMRGLLPAAADDLQAKVPGVGRYTGGAISAIVFGRAAPMVDGNVLRVLSRQLGLLGDVKSDKAVIDLLWAAADALAKAVARDAPEVSGNEAQTDEGEKDWEVLPSDRPGRWGQALMELGSTVCQPKPSCDKCPITASCRAYSEGLVLANEKGKSRGIAAVVANKIVDIEDACSLCAIPDLAISIEGDGDGDDLSLKKKEPASKKNQKTKTPQKKQTSLLHAFAFTKTKTKGVEDSPAADEPAVEPVKNTPLGGAALESVANYAKQFPLKTVKKAVREEETLVCAVRRHDGSYLIHRRPDKGLLAGMWELPSRIIDPAEAATINTPKKRKEEARRFVEDLLLVEGSDPRLQIRHVGELGTIPWLFSHIKLSMHVHLFELTESSGGVEVLSCPDGGRARWTSSIDDESMGTGMRKCAALVQEVTGSS
ncbi:DNA glycosylase [Microdochium bolleyi]|uniref:Adenine DNA glycosylase n=1 Tax=Microdochium bolleyi TaxID=196109 RepID=A0A136JHC4_9PEZI|nr:DNA glycosylase [Microdochium bolleyi]